MDPSKVVTETLKGAPAPNEEAIKRAKEKAEQEEKDRLAAQAQNAKPKTPKGQKPAPTDPPPQGSRGPKSNLLIKFEEEKKKKDFEDRCRRAGEMSCDLLILCGYTFLGPEWNYLPPIEIMPGRIHNEQAEMKKAYGDMFVFYGWDQVPPWLSVVVVTSQYALIRFNMPEVKDKMKGGFWTKVKGVFSGNKKPAPPPPPPATSTPANGPAITDIPKEDRQKKAGEA